MGGEKTRPGNEARRVGLQHLQDGDHNSVVKITFLGAILPMTVKVSNGSQQEDHMTHCLQSTLGLKSNVLIHNCLTHNQVEGVMVFCELLWTPGFSPAGVQRITITSELCGTPVPGTLGHGYPTCLGSVCPGNLQETRSCTQPQRFH